MCSAEAMAMSNILELVILFSCLVISCFCFREYDRPFQEYGVVSANSTFKYVGETLEIYCNITNPAVRENSSMLYFDRNTTRDYVEILTTKAIRLRLPDVEISDGGVYTCLQRTLTGESRLIGHKLIKVDYKPKKVENISCRVYNWEKMNCTWDLGVNYTHPENINVSVAWTIQLHKDDPSYGQQYDCPNLRQTSCLWDSNNYSHGNQYYMMVEVKTVVDGQILMEERSPQFRIETKLYVEPAPVVNLQAVVENSTCIRLSWEHESLPHRLKFFVAQYKLEAEDDNKWKDMILNQEGKDQRYESLKCGLTPFTEYEFQMSVLPFPEETDEPVNQGHRSQWKKVQAKTIDDVPGAAPRICPGCFHEIDCPQKGHDPCYRIYWQDLDEKEKHGILTSYDITYHNIETGESHSKTEPITSPDAVVSYDLELPNAVDNFEVTVKAATRIGYSFNSSQIFIPSSETDIIPPQRFLVEKDKSDDDIRFYLSWAALNTDENASLRYSGITIVWCIGNPLESKCNDDIHWEHLQADQVTYELVPAIKMNDNVLIGITAEVAHQGKMISSGIHWSTCVYLRNLTPQNSPKNVIESPEHPANGLTISWEKYDCKEERSFITEYLVKYCPSYEGKMCRETEKSQNVSNAVSQVTLTNLRADTRYRVNVMAVSTAGLGPPSQLFSQAVKSAPPKPKAESKVWIIIGIVLSIIVAIILIVCCWRYCSSRKKRIPKTEGLIEPYAQTEAFPSKKPQDFRNRPLPKTPDPEDQHFYGSSACMNNHGSDKVKDNRSSESSSENSVTSQTNLLSTLNGKSPSSHQRNLKTQGPHLQKNLGTSKELESLLEVQGLKSDVGKPEYSVFGLVGDSDNNSSDGPKSINSSSGPRNPNMQSSSSGVPTLSSENDSVDSYLKFAEGSGSTSNSSAGKNQQQNYDTAEVIDPRDVELSSMNTLPLRECVQPQREWSIYPALAATQNVPVMNQLSSAVLGGHGKASDISTQNSRTRRNPNYIRKYRPSLYAAQNTTNSDFAERPQAMNPEYVTAPPSTAFSNIPARTEDAASECSTSPEDLPDGYSKMTEAPENKRGSAFLSSVLHFPPPPTSPPPSPCPVDTQYAAYIASLPPFSPQTQQSNYSVPPSSGSSGDPESPQTPTINVNGYIPNEVVHSSVTPSYGGHLHHPPQHLMSDRTAQLSNGLNSFPSRVPAVSVDYLPHDNSVVAQQGTNSSYVPVSMMNDGASYSTATLPRTGGSASSTLPVPSPLSLVSRPLSGDLLALPPKYYEDPNFGGSNQILTEL